MLDFRKTELYDKEWITKLLKSSGKEDCEYCFGNIFVWGPAYSSGITKVKDFLVSADLGEEACYFFPLGEGDLKAVIDEIRKDAHDRGIQLSFYGVSEKDKEVLSSLYPGLFTFEEDRDSFDYIYSQKDLATLSGRKYHSKRNHIAFFEKEEYEYEELSDKNLSDCLNMNEEWIRRNYEKFYDGIDKEQTALSRALEFYKELSFKGALLRRGGQVIAFTLGEAINDNLFCTHFEKAFSDIRGAYPTINRDFAKYTLSDFEFINREEDTGDEGLRKAKLSYHPVKLLKKYKAICNE